MRLSRPVPFAPAVINPPGPAPRYTSSQQLSILRRIAPFSSRAVHHPLKIRRCQSSHKIAHRSIIQRERNWRLVGLKDYCPRNAVDFHADIVFPVIHFSIGNADIGVAKFNILGLAGKPDSQGAGGWYTCECSSTLVRVCFLPAHPQPLW